MFRGSLNNLNNYKLVVDESKCPKFKKIKDKTRSDTWNNKSKYQQSRIKLKEQTVTVRNRNSMVSDVFLNEASIQ